MGPEQSKRCKIKVHGLGLFSFSSRKIQNLTQNVSKEQHLQTEHGPCRQLRGLWIYTSVRHNREIFGLLWFKNNNNTSYTFCAAEVEKKKKKKIRATFAFCTITAVPYFARKISSTFISRHASFTGNSFNLGH